MFLILSSNMLQCITGLSITDTDKSRQDPTNIKSKLLLRDHFHISLQSFNKNKLLTDYL